MYPKDVFHEQRFPRLGHVGRGGGTLGDGPHGDEPGFPFLDSRGGEHAQALVRRKEHALQTFLHSIVRRSHETSMSRGTDTKGGKALCSDHTGVSVS